jgi:hypothetical protein
MSCFKRRLATNAAFKILGDELTSFQQGGCWVAARAIQRAAGGRLVAVASSRQPVEHVVVQQGDRFIDSDGMHTATQLLSKMARREGVPNPRLVPFRRAAAGTIVLDERKARRLSKLLQTCSIRKP